MLTVKNVTKKYGNFIALEDINLEFGSGVYGLLAPNGAGKTTLIKMLTTLIFPTKGEILWEGTDIVALDELYREIVGYLPQQFGYYKSYTPRQYLAYLAALKGIKKPEKRIDELLDLVFLSDVKDKKLKKFSGGMIQRVGIAQAMLGDPKILILDEPTAGLDPKERVRFRNIISDMARERTVILSTHIVSDIESIAKNVVMFKDKNLLYCKSPSDICAEINGKIFETDKNYQLAEKDFLIYENENVKRIYSDSCNAKTAVPNLEDVFLYIYREGINENIST